jgi:hypothetical protein
MNQPLESLEELILASLDPRAVSGLPHPLDKFAIDGTVKDGPCAEGVMQFISDWTWEAPGNARHGAAVWFLFESELAFFRACEEAGIDAEKLRSHLASRL